MSDDSAKRAAARAAMDELPEHGTIGLGTGSTTLFFVEALGELVRGGRRFVGVPTSQATRVLALQLGIPLLDDAGRWAIDVTVDGADEVSEALDLIKGGGGAHAREKIVASASRRMVVVADETKMSRRLGERRAVPVEVLAFGHQETLARLAVFGPATLRERDGVPVRTDAKNLIVDIATGPIEDPSALDREIRRIAGVVETGLFVAMATVVLVGSSDGVTRLAP